MARGRPRLTIEQATASGAIYRNPKRFKGRIAIATAQVQGVNPPTAFLRETPETTKLLEIWNDLVASADGQAREEDKFLLEQLAYAISESRRGGTKMSARRAVTDMLKQWEERLRRRREAQGGGPAPSSSFGEFG